VSKPKNEDLFELYFSYVADTEPPLQFHRWSLIAAVGALLGRGFWLPFGTSRIFPNQYIMLVGNPGTRKSSAIKGVRKILARGGYDSFGADKTTKEKFLLDLEGLPESYGDSNYGAGKGRGGPRSIGNPTISAADVLRDLNLGENEAVLDRVPREVFVCADEFNEFTGSGNIDFFSLLGALWDWDDEHSTYTYRLKNSKSLSIYQPTISILGGNTHTGIQLGFPSESVGQGFMSRLLFIHGEPSGRKIAFPTTPPEAIADRLGEFLKQIKEQVVGECGITAGAKNALTMIYGSWQPLEDYRFQYYSSRRYTHLLKLLLVCAAMRLSRQIDIQDVLLANTLLTHAEHQMAKALGEFGRSRNSEIAQMIMSHLYEAKRPLPASELFTLVARDLDKKDSLPEILNTLAHSGKIQHVKERGFIPLQKPINSKALYVDLKLLKENRI
jgi:hypothetical protein